MSSGPPPGIDLNADIKSTVISPVVALMVLSAACVALRIVAKYTTNVKLQLDDYFLFAALVGIRLKCVVALLTRFSIR
jgi:hypothetical protein